MRVLLTGASGFLGGHLARCLVLAGHDVRVLVRSTSDHSSFAEIPHEAVTGDLRGSNMEAAVANQEVVIHAAGLTKARLSRDFYNINSNATGRLAAISAAAGVERFIYVSSLAAIGPSSDGLPPDPDSDCYPVTAYGKSKAEGELQSLAWADEMAVQIVRPPAVYGPWDRGFLPFFKMANRHFVIRLGNGSNQVALVYGPDCAEAIVSLLRETPRSRSIYHICDNGSPYTWQQMIDFLKLAFGHNVISIPLPTVAFEGSAHISVLASWIMGSTPSLDYSRVKEMQQPAWLSDHILLTKDTAWTPEMDLAKGLRVTLDWYRKHKWI